MPRRECRLSDGLKLSEIKVAFTASRTNLDSDTQSGVVYNRWATSLLFQILIILGLLLNGKPDIHL